MTGHQRDIDEEEDTQDVRGRSFLRKSPSSPLSSFILTSSFVTRHEVDSHRSDFILFQDIVGLFNPPDTVPSGGPL